MKSLNRHLILIAILCLPVMAHTADKKKPAAKKPAAVPTVDTAAVELIKPYDKDGNFEISVDELKAMQADYKAAPRGPLNTLSLSHNGTFDDFDRMNMNNKLGAAKMAANPTPPTTPVKKKKA
ncbi:MAG: hypothetical protein K8R87_13155 [Verrucomicrobia bacterium]|nr:hypothetical protein [Verrucomicrobiota bacterium]